VRRFSFRFIFVYWVLYCFPFPLNRVPKVRALFGWWDSAMDAVVTAAARLLRVSVAVKPGDSGDTTWNWVQLPVLIVLSLAAAGLWMLLDRREHERMREGLRDYVRLFLAVTMIGYGMVKVVPWQFPPPLLDRLVQSYGSSSPMGLLWTFMGASRAYGVFTGAIEMLGGLLLAFRRTTLAGALLSAGAMANVVALNLFYDVPVKIFSMHLLVMALWIAAPDLPRLLGFVFARTNASRWQQVAGVVVVAYAAHLPFVYQQARRKYGDLVPPSPLRGIWRFDELTENGVPRAPLMTDATRWRRLIFDDPHGASIISMDDTRQRFLAKIEGRKITLASDEHPDDAAVLTYSRPDKDTLIVDGTVAGKRVHAVCRLEPEKKYLLSSRGFHWISEYPFDR
jgi:hypothetical protein